ncbi:hypothetical protein BIW11_13961, partial [Tropilaelaps mercedesae]
MEIPIVTIEEITEAGAGIPTGKAPGPDGIPAEALKTLAKTRPEFLAKVATKLLRTGTFPREWKRGRLVLIPKAGKPL